MVLGLKLVAASWIGLAGVSAVGFVFSFLPSAYEGYSLYVCLALAALTLGVGAYVTRNS